MFSRSPKQPAGAAASRSRDAPAAAKQVRITPDDFKGSNVSKAVLSECVQHPATILPAAGSVVAIVATVAIAVTPVGVGLAVGLAFASVSAFVWNYVVNGEQRAVVRVNQLRELRRGQMVTDFDDLAQACLAAGFKDGSSKAASLKQSYLNLLQYLQAHAGTSVDSFRFLAEDTLKQGLQTLTQALDMFKAIGAVDVNQLRAEVSGFDSELAKLAADAPRAKTVQLSIEEHNNRIELVRKHQDQLAELLQHADEIEAALQQTWMELTALGQQDPATMLSDGGDAASRLKSTVEAARRVEESLRGNSASDAALRSKYLDADNKPT